LILEFKLAEAIARRLKQEIKEKKLKCKRKKLN